MRAEAHLHPLSVEECLRLLESHLPRVGRLALPDPNGPVILPVNYVVDRGAIVFRTAAGTKLDAAVVHDVAGFEVDTLDVTWQEGWSVLVQGRLEEVTDPEELTRLAELPLHPWLGDDLPHLVRLLPSAISGRRIA